MDRLPDFVRRLIFRFDVAILIASGALVLGLYIFVKTVGEVVDGDTEYVDRQIVLWVKGLDSPGWFDEIMRDCTAFGGTFVLALTTMAVAVYFSVKRLWYALAFLLTSVLGAFILSLSLKHFFSRARPDIIEHGSYTFTASFPSGHAMLSAAVYLTLGVLLARLERSHWLKTYFILLGIFISFMTGVSRVWLGVHWPTDVLAGWAGGTVWAIACWFLARYLQHCGKIERDINTKGLPAADADLKGVG